MSIVIIGAGLAGLSAAHKLLTEARKRNAKLNLIILEARDKIGGRVESITFQDGSRIDLGAQWLHGQKNNPVYHWLKRLDCIEGPEVDELEFGGVFSTASGLIPPKQVVSRVLDLLMEAKSNLYRMAHTYERHAKPVDIYRKHIDTATSSCQILKRADKKLIHAVERWFELYEMIDNSCEDLSLLSMKAYSDWSDFDDGKMTLLRGGWQSVVDKLVDCIGVEKIHLRHQVDNVRYDNHGVILSVISGQNERKELSCDHVIVTCSVGVLKTLGPDFFVPPMEYHRYSQISKSGFGTVNKIFLQFDEPFLQQEKGLKLLWVDEIENCTSNELPEWARFVTGFDLITGAPNLILGWIGSIGATMIEEKSDHEIGQVCLKIFELFLPNKRVPSLISVRKSTWSTDNHIRGAYSYPSAHTIDDCDTGLWAPLMTEIINKQEGPAIMIPRVLFAGEATATSMYATAHGAIISGWREADRLLDYHIPENLMS